VHPGRYTVRLTVDGRVSERPLDVRLDPRVEIGDADLRLQTDLSMACYRGYLRLQALREAIDTSLAEGESGSPAARRDPWTGLRGAGEPREDDMLYGSIYEARPGKETVVGLQQQLLFLLTVLQNADARPTASAIDAVGRLTALVPALEERWRTLR
jgi:hypothetical protein